jgi:hypothetical protein
LFKHNIFKNFTFLLKVKLRTIMLEKHIDENELRRKILSLFEYRLFPELLDKSDISQTEKSEFYQKLIDLQTAIYHLDAHLEANWDVDQRKLDWHWNNIINNVNLFEIDNESVLAYLSHIRKYEKHELELRSGKTPLRLDMEYFYFYKSCDVKLLRRLIYETYKLSPDSGYLADWRYYDLVTEVNDDVEDLFEDLDFINGNRFLISLLVNGKKETFDVFTKFLDVILSKAQEKFHSSIGHFRSEIFEHTCIRIEETRILLKSQLDKVNHLELNQAKLLQYMKINSIYV